MEEYLTDDELEVLVTFVEDRSLANDPEMLEKVCTFFANLWGHVANYKPRKGDNPTRAEFMDSMANVFLNRGLFYLFGSYNDQSPPPITKQQDSKNRKNQYNRHYKNLAENDGELAFGTTDRDKLFGILQWDHVHLSRDNEYLANLIFDLHRRFRLHEQKIRRESQQQLQQKSMSINSSRSGAISQ